MGNRPQCQIIWAVPIADADWKDEQDNILPAWTHLTSSPEYAEEGFEDVFYPLKTNDDSVEMHSFFYCGEAEERTTFIGVSLWEESWCGESPPLAPTEEQRQALQAFLDTVGLDKTPAIHALLSYG